jgi:hypothetical protein
VSAGKRAKKIARREARANAGDFSVLVQARPLDTELRALYKPVVRAHATRKSAKV